jgi:spermidine/putrescine transport system permease protein
VTAASHVPASETGAPGGRTGRPLTRQRWVPYALLLPGIVWLGLFFVVPMVQLLATSLYDPSGSLETGYVMTFHWQNFTDALASYGEQFLRSFGYAAIATIVTLVISYPLAYAIAFKAGRWRNVLLVMVIAPFFTSFLLRTLAWTTILADNGFVVDALKTVGVLGPGGRLLATPFAVVTGLVYNFLPFMTLPLFASLDRLDPRLIEAAKDLYCSGWTAFRTVTFPLSMPGVVAGTLLTFIPAAGDYINAQLLGTPRQYMIGNVIQSSFLVRLDYPEAAALSFLLVLAIVVLVSIYVRRAGTERLV